MIYFTIELCTHYEFNNFWSFYSIPSFKQEPIAV